MVGGQRPGKTRAPYTNGTYLGFMGKIMFLVAIFLPWYTVVIDVDSGPYATDGWVELVRIDGMQGVQINELIAGSGAPQTMSWLPVPLGWVLLFFFIWSVIGIYRARTARKRGWKFVTGGIIILIVFALVYMMVLRLPDMIPEDSPEAVRNIVQHISDAPLGGRVVRSFGEYGTVDLEWGLRLGGYLLLFSGIVQLIAGVLEWDSKVR